MADFNSAIGKTLQKEGGVKVTEIAGDAGGLTKYGISQRAYPNLDICNITEQQARDIYKRDYWDRICGDRIHDQVIAESIFDFAVNAGPRTSSRIVQLALDIDADGIVGPQTISHLAAVPAKEFLVSFALAKVAYYASICNKDKSQSKFLLGWINRALGGV